MANQQNSYTGSQGTGTNNADFSFTFPSFTTSEVKVEVDNVVKTLTTHYTVENYNTTSGGKVRFTAGNIPTGTTPVRIFRQTDVDSAKATFTAGASLKAGELNDNFKQVRHALQEAIGSATTDRKVQRFNIEADSIDGTLIADDAVDTEHIANGAVTSDQLGANSIINAKIADDQIDSRHYVAGSIDTEHLAPNSVTNAKLGVGTILTASIADNSITNAKLASDAVRTAEIQNASITTAKIADLQVTTAKIADANITTAKIEDDAVNNAKIANNAVDTAQLANGAATSDKLGANSVTTVKIQNDAVTRAKILGDAVDGTKIADDSINSEHYVDGSVDTAHLATGAVTNVKIGADAVNGSKIADDSINSEHYVDGSIDTQHIADDQITTAKIAALAVDSSELASGAVTTTKIGNSQVTTAKIADSQVTTAKIADDAVTYSKMQNTTNGVRFLGKHDSGAGVIGEITAAQALTMLDVETGATRDQTDAEIRAAVESATDSNVFTDADHTKLNNAATLTDAQTLTNKTLTTPVINDFSGTAIVTSGTSTSDNKVYSAKRSDELYSTQASQAAASATAAANSATASANSATSAATQATNAASSASSASTQATNAAASAASATTQANNSLSSYNSFRGQYYGTLASDPVNDPLSNALDEGDIYYNSTSAQVRVYNGFAFQGISENSVDASKFATSGFETLYTASAGSNSINLGGLDIAGAVFSTENIPGIRASLAKGSATYNLGGI